MAGFFVPTGKIELRTRVESNETDFVLVPTIVGKSIGQPQSLVFSWRTEPTHAFAFGRDRTLLDASDKYGDLAIDSLELLADAAAHAVASLPP
jgi:hypothetical protein